MMKYVQTNQPRWTQQEVVNAIMVQLCFNRGLAHPCCLATAQVRVDDDSLARSALTAVSTGFAGSLSTVSSLMSPNVYLPSKVDAQHPVPAMWTLLVWVHESHESGCIFEGK